MPHEIFPGWSPREVGRHYGFPLDRTGRGQRIGIVSLGGAISMDELRRDFRRLGVPMPSITEIPINPEKIGDAQNEAESVEAHLDLEVVGSLCPDAEIRLYRGSASDPMGFTDTVKAALSDGNHVVSISWSFTEHDGVAESEMERLLADAARRGVTVCASASDYGSSNTRDPKTGLPTVAADGGTHVSYPASSPHVLACGGTELMEDEGCTVERVWNNVHRKGGVTGGGVSRYFPRPSWQEEAGVRISAPDGGRTGRVVPDVAALAAGRDWKIFLLGKGVLDGGTSAAAPLWAALVALVNEMRAEEGKGPLGHVNETLYRLASKGSLFREVLAGDNRSAPEYPGYDAGPGFDACTGWGTPEGPALVSALAAFEYPPGTGAGSNERHGTTEVKGGKTP